MNDMDIANKCSVLNISDVASKLGVSNDNIICYGNDKAKIRFNNINCNKNGKVILVTAINPTPYGEGKTTVSIGLNDGINKLGYNSLCVLREPSLGPVFGVKGGACGGGYSQVVPMDDINLHFTGDIHAVTCCNNMICAAIDNHIYQGNSLGIDVNNILFKRCMDINDRALRDIDLGNRREHFDISAASEIMSILCLFKDLDDLRERLSNILVAYSCDGNPIYVRDLGIVGSLMVILKDAIYPNLVQSLENNPVIIHGGPFANISIGCSSLVGLKAATKLSDYVVTEAGFGSDMGAIKFFDIMCKNNNISPNCIVIVCTVRALKYNSSNNSINDGLSNLGVHIDNMLKYSDNVIVCLNKFDDDSNDDINIIRDYVLNKNVKFDISTSYNDGSDGSLELARDVVSLCNGENKFKCVNLNSLSMLEKIEFYCKDMFHAKEVIFSDKATKSIDKLNDLGYGNLPVCIAKTQYSISDNPKLLGSPSGYTVTVRDVEVKSGAGFVVCYLGNIVTMPGLSKKPNLEVIDMDNNFNIRGLF